MDRILVAGATGQLGSRIVAQLRAAQRPVRALVRNPDRARPLAQLGAELVQGDLLDPASLRRACDGATHVITTANAFLQKGTNTPANVDIAGTGNLAKAAKDAGVKRFVYESTTVAVPDSIVDFFRYKYQAEQAIRASGVRYTIVRSPAFMDVWAEIILGKAKTGGAAVIFGDGKRKVNFIAIDDVARESILLMDDPAAENQAVDIRGPEDVTLLELVEAYEQHLGRAVKRRHIPIPAMKILRHAIKPVSPVVSRMISGGLHMATSELEAASSNARVPDGAMTFKQWLHANW